MEVCYRAVGTAGDCYRYIKLWTIVKGCTDTDLQSKKV